MPAQAEPRLPLPPFTEETARAKVQAAENVWNTRRPKNVAGAYTPRQPIASINDLPIRESERRHRASAGE